MADRTEAMDNLIAQDAELIEICPDDLVRRLRSNRPIPTIPHEAADRIEAQAAEIERLREALGYYAQELMTGPWGIDSLDFGDVARAALEQTKW